MKNENRIELLLRRIEKLERVRLDYIDARCMEFQVSLDLWEIDQEVEDE